MAPEHLDVPSTSRAAPRHRPRTWCAREADGDEVLFRRLQTAQRELATVELFDYVVFNESGRPDQAVEQIMAILQSEKHRIHQPEVVV